MKPQKGLIWSVTLATVLGLVIAGSTLWPDAETTSVIVQGKDLDSTVLAVREAGGVVTHELGIINAVGATFSERQLAALESTAPDLRIHQDGTLQLAAEAAPGDYPYVNYPSLVGADRLHELGITGKNVTVAVLDSGMQYVAELQTDTSAVWRVKAKYSAVTDTEGKALDRYGHGSHISSIIFSTDTSNETVARYNSVAPDVQVVAVKAFDNLGVGTYANVIQGLDYILNHKEEFDIRVLNLSFSAEARSHYWDDPVNQAVMRLWQAGVVVVTSAGNRGPDAMTIGVPGNVPYVITVGAMTDNYTPADGSDDVMASFSSAGPTVEGFVKPEVVAPGGHMTALTRVKSTLAKTHPEFHDMDKYFTMSGTSQAAAMVTGAVALLLDAQPNLTPDDVKCVLMSSARPALDNDGNLAYGIFQQGAGLVNAFDAVYEGSTGCANRGLDIDADLDGTAHFLGRSNRDENGNYYIEGLDGYIWSDAFVWSDGYIWSDAFVWSDSFIWSDSYIWSDSFIWSDAFVWSDAYVWNDGYIWSDGLTESASVNVWVPQE